VTGVQTCALPIYLRKTDLFTTVIPSKLFECMGMGLPVLHGVAGESAEIVRGENAGMVFEPENAEQLIAGIKALRHDPQGYAAYQANCLTAARHYDRRALAQRMLGLVEGLA